MADRIYTYVDGESHFVRLTSAIRAMYGEGAQLSDLRHKELHDAKLILCIPDAKVFWSRRWSPGQRVMYFTSASGDDASIHKVKKTIREFGLDHYVWHERKTLADQRRQLLEQRCVIEKAKAVDTAIVVQMLEDAHRDLYDLCNLYTSDVDYAPAIQAVQNRGKRVYVHGFKSGLADHSPLEHLPNGFFDLGATLLEEFAIARM